MSLVDVIGKDLAEQLTLSQREYVQAAADEAPDGLRQVAAEIRAAGTKIERPVAVLLNRIKRGQHEDRQPGAHAPARGDIDKRDWARRLYVAKISHLRQHATQWSEAEQREHAIDYALDHCRASGAELWRIQHELQAQHGVQLTGTERDFERDTDHRRLMYATHSRQAELETIPGEPEAVEVNP